MNLWGDLIIYIFSGSSYTIIMNGYYERAGNQMLFLQQRLYPIFDNLTTDLECRFYGEDSLKLSTIL